MPPRPGSLSASRTSTGAGCSEAGGSEPSPAAAWHPPARLASAVVRAVTFSDNAVVVADRADPVPGYQQILVRVRAAGLNGADLIQLRGRYPAPPGVPADIPG